MAFDRRWKCASRNGGIRRGLGVRHCTVGTDRNNSVKAEDGGAGKR
jgi:hypothetical protein